MAVLISSWIFVLSVMLKIIAAEEETVNRP